MRYSSISFFSSCLLALSCFYAWGDDSTQPAPLPPEEIEKQLTSAQEEFDEAKKMFNPWYAGPLLTGSAHILTPGLFNIQPYLFITDNYAKYSSSGKTQHIPDLRTINPVFIGQIGMISWMDLIFSVQTISNSQSHHHSTHFGDSTVSLAFGLLQEQPYVPALLFAVKETFPSGKYQRLDGDKGGVDSTGGGSYQTTFTLNMSKVVWWLTLHPMDLRLSLNYTIPADVTVHGFNTYGGGHGTHGTVDPGNNFAGNIGYEFSFTQKWVIALDIAYVYTSKTTFSGNPGEISPGVPASVGGPFNDQLSLAPALEYNPNPNLGFIAGVWCSVWGRNSLAFVSGVLSFTYTF